MSEKIWLSSPHMGGGELKYIQEAYDSNWVAPLGPNVDGFENDLVRYTGANHVAALNSGTAAIHLALVMLGVKPGDFVICQSMTFSASANPISYLGATPVFVDSEQDTWNMCPVALVKAIEYCYSKSKPPRAIIPVHLYGMPAKIKQIMAIGSEFNIPIIEDAAESLGATFDGIHTGTFGDMGVLSFNGNKIITTSGGGALISDKEDYIKQAKFLSTQARDDAPHYQHSHIGYNYRMSNILAGIGRGQMEVLEDRISERRAVNHWYRSYLESIPGVSFQNEPSASYFSNYWLSAILLDSKLLGCSTDQLRKQLLLDNIESRPLWKPMHMQPIFNNCPYFGSGIAEELFKKGLCLPSGSNLSDNQKVRIKERLLDILT